MKKDKISKILLGTTIIFIILFCNIVNAENLAENNTKNNNIMLDTNTTQNENEQENENNINIVQNQQNNLINTIENKQEEITIKYDYNEETNQVIAQIVSEVELQDTKPTWTLSKDKKTYTKIYTKNESYSTQVVDINGNITYVDINITQIQDTKIDIQYVYDKKTNQVTAIITSNTELQDTKPTWDFGEDKRTYTKIYTQNESYSTDVVDINGTVINVKINITQIKETVITMDYDYDEKTNKVIAIMTSNVELQDTKPTWTLSADKKSYTKVYTENQSYSTDVVDINGKVTSVEINITQIKETVITMSYKYDDETNQVTAIMTSNIELQNTKPTWNLSTDKKTYTKIYTENQSYSTDVVNIYGQVISVNINITQIDEIAPVLTLDYKYNADNTVTVTMKSNEKLKDTKPSWTLSTDGYTYTKTYTESSQSYGTEVFDSHGISTIVRIEYETKKYVYNQNDNSTITVKYLYANDVVTVNIVSSIQMQDTKPTWKLSADRYTFTKMYTGNDTYKTNIIDINGNTKTVDILVNFFKDGTRYDGIDVSFYQKYIMWDQVKASGIDFAMIRAGFRGYGSSGSLNIDPQFVTNLRNSALAGMDIGIYFYSQAITVEEAIEEADFVIDLLRRYNIGIKYPIAIDTERTPVGTGRADYLSPEQRTDICIAFCERIEQAGYKSMIYANKDWLLNDLNLSRLSDYDIWLAHYTNETDFQYAYTMWQYTSGGTVNGIIGNVDMNYCYKKY